MRTLARIAALALILVLASAPAVLAHEGRMTGGGSVFADDGTRVTHGFQLRCDALSSPQRLQVNFHPPGGSSDSFHLTDLDWAFCDTDPSIDPRPPQAGFNVYEAGGYGRFNGEDGYFLEWIFTDAGEPGTEDEIRLLRLWSPGFTEVLFEVTDESLTFGNHQAHRPIGNPNNG